MKITTAIFTACVVFAGCAAPQDQSVEMADPATDLEATLADEGQADVAAESPEGWLVRLDRPDSSVTIGPAEDADVYFATMEPGFHVTTHKAGIFYHPDNSATGVYSAEVSIHLFDPGDRNREAFGMFVGGRDLDTETQAYTYFLLRNEGDFLIKRRTGDETAVLVDWTHSDAVVVHPHDGTDSVLNVLEVRTDGESANFIVNGTQVASVGAADVRADGVVGLRLNHGLNVHVSDIVIDM